MSYASTILATSGLVAFWELGDASGSSTAADAGPNGITGTPTSVTFGASGQGGQTSASFNGSSSIIGIPAVGALNGLTTFTIEGWVYSVATNDGSAMFTQGFFNNKLNMEVGFDSTAHDGTGFLPFVAYYNGNSGGWQSAFASSVLPNNQWVYLVGTFDGTTLKLYINGILAGNFTTSIPWPGASNSYAIGRRHDTSAGSPFFDGDIQYVAIYNRALSQSEITAHFNILEPTGASGLVEKSDIASGSLNAESFYTTGFSFSPMAGPASLSVSFTDTSSVIPSGTDTEISWSWDFGDGETSTSQNPSHTYQNEGTYTIRFSPTWNSEGVLGPVTHSVIVLPRQAISPGPPAAPNLINVSQYLSLIIPEHRYQAPVTPIAPALGFSRIQETYDSGAGAFGTVVSMGGAILESHDIGVFPSLFQIFEAPMSSPTWPTNIFGSNPQNSPVILSVSPDVSVINRNYQGSSLANTAGDGNVYHYSNTTGALTSTTLQSAAPVPFQNWKMMANRLGAGPFIMAMTDGNNLYMGNSPITLSSSTNFVSAASSNWPNGPVVFDFGNLLFTTSGFSGSDQIWSTYPCADFEHALVILATGGAVSKWAIINCVHGSEAVTQHGTITDATTKGIAFSNFPGGGSSISTNDVAGTSNATRPLGCLQSDLRTFWNVFFNVDGPRTSFAGITVCYIDQSTLNLSVQLGVTSGTGTNAVGTPAFPASNASQSGTNIAASIWADKGTCAILAGQYLTVWQVS